MKDYIATYPIGLPISAIKRLQEIAQERYLPPTVMARGWLLERLEAEDRKEDRIPAPGD